MIVLGGDGSVLRALQPVTGRGVPVFAVNFGRVGFLTTAEPDELETAVARALAGELQVVELATVQVERDGDAHGAGRQRRRGRERRAGAHRAPRLERRRRRPRRAGLRRRDRLHARGLDGLRAVGRRAGARLGRRGAGRDVRGAAHAHGAPARAAARRARRGRQPRARAAGARDPRRRPERPRARAGRVGHASRWRRSAPRSGCCPRSRSCSAIATPSPADARGARRREPRARALRAADAASRG